MYLENTAWNCTEKWPSLVQCCNIALPACQLFTSYKCLTCAAKVSWEPSDTEQQEVVGIHLVYCFDLQLPAEWKVTHPVNTYGCGFMLVWSSPTDKRWDCSTLPTHTIFLLPPFHSYNIPLTAFQETQTTKKKKLTQLPKSTVSIPSPPLF